MLVKNLEVIFTEDSLTVTVSGLTQWDRNRQLYIKGLDLPTGIEIHFADSINLEAIVMIGTKQEDGSTKVDIPNILLENPYDIHAWIYLITGEEAMTVRDIYLKIEARAKPQNFVSKNPDAEDLLQDMINKINEQIEDNEAFKEDIIQNANILPPVIKSGEMYSGVASNNGIKLHKVVGKTIQKTTNGYQLFDASKLPTKSQGGATVTNNGDGSFTVSGSGELTESFRIGYIYDAQTAISLLKVGKATLKELLSLTVPYAMFGIYDSNGLPYKIISNRYGSLPNIQITQDDIDKLASGEYTLRIFIFGGTGETITPATLKPMVYQDGDGTWEPYTGGQPSPNPDYPQEPQFVEIENFYSYSQNILNADKYYGSYKSGDVYTATNAQFNSIQIPIPKQLIGKSLMFSADLLNGQGCSAVYLTAYYDGSNHISNTATNTSDYTQCTVLFIPKSENDYVKITYGSGNGIIYVKNIMLAISDATIPYVPYQGSNQQLSSPLNLLALPNGVCDTWINGQITRNVGSFTFDGSSDESWTLTSTITNTIQFGIFVGGIIPSSQCLCDKFIYIGNTSDVQHILIGASGNLYIHIDKSILTDGTLDAFKTWLQSNPVKVWYQLATPTTEQLAIPTLSSYSPYTSVWTDNEIETDIEWEILGKDDNSLAIEYLIKRIEALEQSI